MNCDIQVLTTNANGLGCELDVEPDCDIRIASGLRVRYCQRLWRHSVSLSLLEILPSYLQKAEVVHLTGVYSFPTLPTLYLCKKFGKPVVWSPRGAFQRWSGSRRRLLKSGWDALCYRLMPQKIISHVTSQQEAVETNQRFPNLECVEIPNGVDIPEEGERRDRGEIFSLLFLGRLDPKKGIENLLGACKQLVSELGQKFSLTIAGSGERSYEKFLKNEVSRLGLLGKVIFVGIVEGDKKRCLFDQADVTIVPSYTENFGLVIAESLAHGVPVVSSTGTPWKRLQDKKCGLWVENDCDSLAKAIKRIGQMPLEEMGQNGRLWMQQEYAWNTVAEEMLQVYKKIVKSSSPVKGEIF